MALLHLTPKRKLIAVICISSFFFVAEVVVSVYTGSLAVLADAFHYLTDLTGFIVALVAIILSEKAESPQAFSFGWARARLLGAFFNGVFLVGLGLSIFLQSIERFLSIRPVENPRLVLIIGSIGLGLNILSATLLHEHHSHHGEGHDHGHSHSERAGSFAVQGGDLTSINVEGAVSPSGSPDENILVTPSSDHTEHRHTVIHLRRPGRDLGMLGVLVHVVADAVNNLAVILLSLVIWLTSSPKRFYVDPGISIFISILIMISSIPLVKNSGSILMETAPRGVLLGDVKHDLEKIPGINSVHELHIWRLDQKKALASAHVVVSNNDVTDFMELAKTVSECLHEYGIHSVTLQPEYVSAVSASIDSSTIPGVTAATRNGTSEYGESSRDGSTIVPIGGVTSTSATLTAASGRRPFIAGSVCQIVCGTLCGNLTCCDATGSLRLRTRESRSTI